LITSRIATIALGLLLLPAAAVGKQKAVIFPFDLIDQQQQFEIGIMPMGIDPEDKRRLELITNELAKLIEESGEYDVVDSSPIAEKIEEKSPIHQCNGCEDQLAKDVGADVAFVSTVRKASDVLFTVSVYIRDVNSERVFKQASSEIYGNTDAMWLRSVNYIVKRRLFPEDFKGAKAAKGETQ